ncbi:XdhC family protein [Rhizobium laguerreae]|uniref:XdhC family protein n=1 Tax=Rhizobium laguerreae TaxID=1076926 RepID=UPI001C8FE397|nr:XdhC family protein [Rhizobium laguerreae]MBY3259654.1 XdhC family protein [Rhizobium laguerreae]MBY3287365.1 XdhC family protein [Rhizobium laguerreae]MBY3293988.1 XdhC family protein [Rhizobium laguerreae]
MLNSFSVLDTPPVPVCAFVTDDAAAIINYAADGADCGLGSALVTLVEIRGGAARALGAQMAVRGDGSYCGYVSGGCTEAAVATEAIAAISNDTDRYLSLGEGSPFFDISLPRGGGITLAIHVVRDVRPLRQVLTALERRRSIALHYVPGTQTITAVKAPIGAVSSWSETAFLRVYRPNLRLVLCGRGIELEATTRVAMASEFEVFALDQKSRDFDANMIDQETAVAVLFHDLDQELPWLEAGLRRKPFYIGALGSKRTHERRCQALRDLGYSPAETDRIKAPIGLFGPTRDANALALSVVAEVAQAFSVSQN